MSKDYKILIVDDSEINRSMLVDMLSQEYEILEASNGLEAISCLNKHYSDISLVLLDIIMPEMNGFEVLSVMQKSHWIESIPVIMISAETSSVYMNEAYNLGAIEYINRPFDENTVRHRVKNTLMLYSKQKYLEDVLTEQILEKEKSNFIMVTILSHIVEFRNGESGMHVIHIRAMTEMLLRHLVETTDLYSLTKDDILQISYASAMHDIGKITIPEEILNKPGRLTEEERKIMMTHSVAGSEILKNSPYFESERLLQIASDICRWHHERYDGCGYPDGLKGDEIPIGAQVVSLTDVYDALTSDRIYKPAFTHEQAMEMILNGECGVFNPVLLEALKEIGPSLQRELKEKSAGDLSQKDIRSLAQEAIKEKGISNRTLGLLEQERTKYQFFASLSKEVQFEYSYQSNLLTVSDWGAELLGLPTLVIDPTSHPQIKGFFQEGDMEDFVHCIRTADVKNPVVDKIYSLNLKNGNRWYRVIARTLWIEEEHEITGFIGKFVDVHEEHEQMQELQELANRDSLTKIHHHRYAKNQIEKILQENTNSEKTYQLLIIDLDNFKKANDHYGHSFGDKVLCTVSEKIKDSVRQSDVVARIGGDEFLIFAEYKEDPKKLVQRVFMAIPDYYKGFPITASVGISLFPQDGRKYTELFNHADKALYIAKSRGKNTYHFYGTE